MRRKTALLGLRMGGVLKFTKWYESFFLISFWIVFITMFTVYICVCLWVGLGGGGGGVFICMSPFYFIMHFSGWVIQSCNWSMNQFFMWSTITLKSQYLVIIGSKTIVWEFCVNFFFYASLVRRCSFYLLLTFTNENWKTEKLRVLTWV